MQQQITRGDYLEDLITIYIENNLQQGLDDLYDMFVFQCGEIQKQLTPAPVIKISFTEAESKLLTNYNTCYLAGITKDGHKETFNGSISFNTRGEVVYYEPTPNSSLQVSTTSTIACPCTGISGVFANCTQPAIKAYFSINYVPTKLSELINDTDFVDSVDVAESISIHNASTEAHPYIQDLIATEASLRNSQTEALGVRIDEESSLRASQTSALHESIVAEATARDEAISLAISTTEGYADTSVSVHNASTEAHPYIQSVLTSTTEALDVKIGDLDNLDTSVKSSVVNAINSEVTARENADNNLQGQIDGLAAASDVTDIVGTYAELQAYDTQHLNDNDIIKVLSDSTHDDQPSYYRFNKTAGTFSYIGSESAAYTKAQADAKFVTQTTTINGEALSQNITLTATEVGALPSTTTINDLTTTAQQNAINSTATTAKINQIATNTTNIASNTSAISTINGKIPTDASSSNKLVSASTLSASIANFANKDLNNLSTVGTQKLRSLNAYANEGELLTDPDGLAFVDKYAHSTFDLSKFTVVGSPNITDDGILSNCSKNNAITVPVKLSELANKSWTVKGSATLGNSGVVLAKLSSVADNDYQYAGSVGWNRTNDFIYVELRTGDNNDDSGQAVRIRTADDTFVSGDTVYYALSFDLPTGTYSLYCDKTNGTTLIGSWTATTTNPQLYYIYSKPDHYLSLGSGGDNAQYLTSGSINLKDYEVIIESYPVFSGNKTGIDTIKPDDYTVVGTPTISADGIASGFSTDDYLVTPSGLIDTSKPFKLELPFDFKEVVVGTQQTIYQFDGNTWSNCFTINSSSKITYYLPNTTNTQNVKIFQTSSLSLGKYLIILEWTGTEYIVIVLDENGTQVYNSNYSSSDTIYPTSDTQRELCIGNAVTTNTYPALSAGTIDLNKVKYYSNGNLVYQPCLKIPYTESKTGSKIVDSIYRDRVDDMAEQFGYANYYTLSDTDFTLPQVELYGLIGQRTLRDSYRNGAIYWELWSDRTLEIGGTCTSGVEYNLPRNFASATDYVLSIPYSAKTASSFTPTTSGDFIAKGLGVL